ncbi:MAG TPA: serine/threonine-protein kinase [Solirubrobacteraceae bacterium]|nr:serine/threonine-protein kinase [Solirubrobacteraceae bacterium]
MRRAILHWRPLALFAVAVLAAGAGLGVRSAGTFGWLERPSLDARFSLRAVQPTPRGVELIGIDNDTLGELPRYPFSRKLHARVIKRLKAAGARLIVYDISFDRPTTVDADQALYDAARQSAPLVFATALISPGGSTEVLGGNANLARIGSQAAAANLPLDSDGVLRRMLDQVSGLPTVAAAVAGRLAGAHDAEQAQSTARRMRGSLIDFHGPAGAVPTLSFLRVLRGRFDPTVVRGKVVVVGATAPVLQDVHRVALGGEMPGPEAQAEAISTALRDFPLRDPPTWVATLTILLLAALAPLAAARFGTLGVAVAGAVVLGVWSLGAQLAFNRGAVLDYSDPLVSLLLATAGAGVLALWEERRERHRLRMLFAADATAVVEGVLGGGAQSRRLAATGIIAGYRIEQVVGRGGMGVVYRATQLTLDRVVAIKLIATERAQDPVFRERFERESRIAASIEHANVIPVYETGDDDGLLFIAMRLVDGVDLAQRLRTVGALTPGESVRLGEQLAGALTAAHARGLVHRDVKPANVLLTFDQPQHAYLTDFGIAKRVGSGPGELDRGDELTAVDRWVGSLDYLAPEQIQGAAVDARADVYALAGVLHSCLTAEVPYPREQELAKLWAHLNAAPPSPCRLRGELPAAVDRVIARGMAKDPGARYATAVELACAYAEALGEQLSDRSAPPSDTQTSFPRMSGESTVISE